MDYFKNPAIGSTLLARFIDHQDNALMEVKPTGFMEAGKIFEDLIEEEVTGKSVFSDKYFKSDVDLSPESAAWKKLLPFFEDVEYEDKLDIIGQLVDEMYVWNTKPDKQTGKIELNKTHKKLHRALDQIKAHDYRRLIPQKTGDAIFKMFENFKRAQVGNAGLFAILSHYDTRFQVERFWKHEDADCKMKSDIELFWDVEGQKYGLNFDLKVTANFSTFVQNWKKSYIWQYIHYSEGFREYCEENNIIPYKMLYVICEASEPYLVRVWDLSDEDIEILKPRYFEKLGACQEWIDNGKPTKGYREQQTVNRFGSEV